MQTTLLIPNTPGTSRAIAGLTPVQRMTAIARRLGGDAPTLLVEAPPIEAGPHLLLNATMVLGRSAVMRMAAAPPDAFEAIEWRTLDGTLVARQRGDGPTRQTRVEYIKNAASAADHDAALQVIWSAARKPMDGWVAQHINRPFSLFISRRLAATPITPNMVSIGVLAIGLAGAWSIAFGGTGGALLGAVLFQLNSMLDGVDGELARAKWAESRLGAKVDWISDVIAVWSTFTALLYTAATGGHRLAFATGVAGGVLGLAFVLMVVIRFRQSGMLRTIDLAHSVEGESLFVVALAHVGWLTLRRDFLCAITLVFAAAGVLHGVLFLAPIGATLGILGVLSDFPAPATQLQAR